MKKNEPTRTALAAKRRRTSQGRQSRGSKTKQSRRLREADIDEQVAAEAEDDSAWEPAVNVSRTRAAVGLPPNLAQRAAFLAQLHREHNLQSWVERVVRERVELEEQAFSQARRELASKTGA